MYHSQPLNKSYFPPNQEKLPNVRRQSTASATNTQQAEKITSASEDEGSIHISHDIPWLTVKCTKRKDIGVAKTTRLQTHHQIIDSMP